MPNHLMYDYAVHFCFQLSFGILCLSTLYRLFTPKSSKSSTICGKSLHSYRLPYKNPSLMAEFFRKSLH